MPLTPAFALVVEEAMVMQSSGRFAPQVAGHVSGGLRFGPIGVEAELALTGGGVETSSRTWSGVSLRPALVVEGAVRRGPFVFAVGAGPAVTATWTEWAGYDPWWQVAPGARVRAECRWDLGASLSLSVGTGAMVRVGGPDLDLGLGLRWSR